MENYNQEEVQRPFDEVLELKKRKEFSTREVGLTHPDNPAFMRISDSGEVEVFAAPGVGIVINPHNKSISFFADSIKFYSREDDGLRWNHMSFNPAADVYNEPALVKTNDFSNNPAYFRTSYYLNNLDNLDDLESNEPITIIGEYGLSGDSAYSRNVSSEVDLPNLTANQKLLLDEYSKSHSTFETSKVKEFIQNGYSFTQAVQKVDENNHNISDNLENFPNIINDVD